MGVVLDLGSEAGWDHFPKALSCVDASCSRLLIDMN